jgi:TRAP-type C4-dicarboxylate transport system permease small subunit
MRLWEEIDLARLLARLELAIGAVLLLVITFLVFSAAVMRFFGHPLIWSVDMAQLLLIWLCFFGATRAMRERAHLGVDLVVRHFGRRTRLGIELGLAALFVAFMAVLAWEGYKLTLLNKERIFGDSGFSYGFVTIAVPAGCILLSAVIIVNAVQAWRDPQGRILVFARADADTDAHQEV